MTSSYSYAPPEPTRPASTAPTSAAGAGQRPRAGTGPGAIPVSPQVRVDSSYPVIISPFTQVVVDTVRKLFPEEWADKSFDNTGLLLEAPMRHDRRQKNAVLLTIDLTQAVADEAIGRQVSVVIAYHPIIFKPLKSLTLADSQQRSLLRLTQEGISVYSPHTAVDAAPYGLGNWLADIVTGDVQLGTVPHERKIIIPAPPVLGMEDAGMGRIVRFRSPQPLGSLINRVAGQLGGMVRHLPLAIPLRKSIEETTISSVAVCAGSGGSILRDLDVDMLLTGELSHHETLTAIEKGQVVLAPYHTNTERGYLEQVLAFLLSDKLEQAWGRLKRDCPPSSVVEAQVISDWHISVHVSELDRDPFQIVEVASGR